jgi:hypothetical protein
MRLELAEKNAYVDTKNEELGEMNDLDYRHGGCKEAMRLGNN